MMLLKLTALKKLFAVSPKTSTITPSAKMTGALPRLPPRTFSQSRCPSGSAGGAISISGTAAVGSTLTPSPRARRPPYPAPWWSSRPWAGRRWPRRPPPPRGRGGRHTRHLGGRPGRDRHDDLLLRRLLPLVDGDAAAEAEDGDPRRDLEDVVEVVRDQHDGEALLR